MRTKFLASAMGVAVLVAAPGAVSAAPILGIDYSPSAAIDTASSTNTWTLGWQFQDNVATSVVALGTLDSGISGNVQVGLWNSSGTLLASTTVDAADGPVGSAPWAFAAITPVALTPGANYYVGSYGVTGYQFDVNPVTVSSDITFVDNAWTFGGLTFPNMQSPVGDNHAFFGGNIELGSSVAVPEPASLAIIGAGLAGIAAVRRRRRVGQRPVRA